MLQRRNDIFKYPSTLPHTAVRARALAAVFLSASLLGGSQAEAQTPSPPPAGTAPAFVVQSDNGDNRLQLGAFMHLDGRFALDDDQQQVTDTFVLRRFRSILQGRVARHFDYYLNVDLAGNVVNVRDAYVDTRFSDAFRLRAGKFKTPFSYDRLILVVNTLFVERGFTTGVAPDRDLGFQVFGDVAGSVVSYAASLTNGVADGGNSDTTDGNEGKDLAGRLLISPWARRPAHPLARLGFAVAATTGEQAGPLPSFQTSARQTYFTYEGTAAEGRRTRWSPQVIFYRGPFGGYGEYVRSSGDLRKGAVTSRVEHAAWQAVASWVVTGESAVGERNVRPRVNFDPPSRHWGALQLTVRYQELSVSSNAFDRGFAAPTASRRARAVTAGANWYLNPFIKWNLNFERTVFAGQRDALGSRAPENALLLRAHLGF